jgi:hypothetical protein
MSPFWSRKRSSSAADERRRALAERERRRYEREREAEEAGIDVEPEAEAQPGGREARGEPERRPLLPKTAQRTTRGTPKPAPKRRLRVRRRRRSKRPAARRKAAALGGVRSASRSGARATRSGTRATVREAGPGVGRMLARLAALAGSLLALLLRLAGLVERVLLAVIDAGVGIGERLVSLGERELTPRRMLVFVIVVCGGLLIYSQFVDYRGVEVGQPDYSAVSTIAPAPQTDTVKAGAAHAYVLIPVALLAIGIAIAALVTGRWKLGRLVALLGVVGIAVSLAIDLPKGLDEGTAGTAFAGAHATLTEGFYAQIFASAVLVLCGWTLAAQLRASSAAPAGRKRGTRSFSGGAVRRTLGRLPRRRRSSPAGGGA